MKRISVLLVAVGMVLLSIVSCTKDSTNDAAISLAGDTGFTAADASVTAGGTFMVKWTATSSTNMAYVSITKDDGAIPGWNEKEIASSSKSTYIDQATITVPLTVGTYTYAIIIFNSDKGELVRKTLVITVTAASTAGTINTYAGLILGGSTSSNGSYLDAETGTVYKLAGLTANTIPLVDIIFDVAHLYNSDGGNFSSGTGTKFATSSISTSAFDAITDDSSFSSLTATAANIAVAADAVVFFETASGKKGLIKVKTLSATTAAGNLTIDVKIQK